MVNMHSVTMPAGDAEQKNSFHLYFCTPTFSVVCVCAPAMSPFENNVQKKKTYESAFDYYYAILHSKLKVFNLPVNKRMGKKLINIDSR